MGAVTTSNLRDTAPSISATLMTSNGAPVPASRAVLIECTGTGTITIIMADSTIISALTVQNNTLYEWNYSVIGYIQVSGTVRAWALY